MKVKELKAVTVRRWLVVCFIGAVTLVTALVTGATVHATSSSLVNSAVQKSKFYAMYRCYTENHMEKEIDVTKWAGIAGSTISPGIASVGGKYSVLDSGGLSDTEKWCFELYGAYARDNDGLDIPPYGASAENIGAFLQKVGYQAAESSGSSGRQCATFNFQKGSYTSETTICADVNAEGQLSSPYSDGFEVRVGDPEAVKIEVMPGILHDDNNTTVTIGFDTTSKNESQPYLQIEYCNEYNEKCLGYALGITINPGFTNGETFAGLISKIKTAIDDVQAKSSLGFNWRLTNNPTGNGPDTIAKYALKSDLTAAADDALLFFSHNTYRHKANLALSDTEKVALLQNYLQNFYGYDYYYDNNTACNASSEDAQKAEAAGFKLVRFNSSNACYISGPLRNQDKTVLVYDASGAAYMSGSNRVDYDTLISMLGEAASRVSNSDLNPPEGPGAIPGSGPSDPGSSDPGASDYDQPLCYQAAATLGWILCPVLEGLGHVTSGIYDAIVEPFLNISADFFSQDGNVEKGWTDFRNFANILFAIAFIIVILAQVTGIGISNYNIKKILPRLIMVVVLVNLSFIICQLLVDVSNILGSGLYNLFKGLAKDMPAAGVSAITNGFMQSLGMTAITGGAIFGIGVLAVSTWEMWLIPLLLTLLACVIGVIFFFIILAVRQAGVIILIVMAPVAIVCYALPNTQNIFKRWWKMLSSLLLVYPICGALIGGGQYVGALLARTDSGQFFFNLAAMLVQIVPFFLIPSIVKSSMNAMGQLGAKISGFGQRLGGGLRRGIGNTDAVREAQRSLGMHNARRSFDRADKRLAHARTKSGKARLERRKMLAANRYNRSAFEDIRAGGGRSELLKPGSAAYNAAMQGETSRQQKEDDKNYEAMYTAGSLTQVDDNNTKVDVNDFESISNEHFALMQALDKEPENKQYLGRMHAIQNIATNLGDKGQETLRNSYARYLASQTSPLMNGTTTGLSIAAGHLASDHISTYKANDRGMYAMINDLNRKDYTTTDANGATIANGGFRQVPGTGAGTNRSPVYASAKYDTAGTGSYTKQTLANANEGALRRLRTSAQNGTLQGKQLSDLADTANQILSDPTMDSLKPEVRDELVKIAASSYSKNAQSQTVDADQETIASKALSAAGEGTLSKIANSINSANAATLTQADKDEYRDLAENARRTLKTSDRLSQPQIDHLQDIISGVKRLGIKDIDGNDFRAVDPSTIHVRSAAGSSANQAPQELQEISYGDFVQNTVGSHGTKKWQVAQRDSQGNVTGYRNVTADEMEKIKEIREANKVIRNKNIENGYIPHSLGGGNPNNPPAPNPNPPTPPPNPPSS